MVLRKSANTSNVTRPVIQLLLTPLSGLFPSSMRLTRFSPRHLIVRYSPLPLASEHRSPTVHQPVRVMIPLPGRSLRPWPGPWRPSLPNTCPSPCSQRVHIPHAPPRSLPSTVALSSSAQCMHIAAQHPGSHFTCMTPFSPCPAVPAFSYPPSLARPRATLPC